MWSHRIDDLLQASDGRGKIVSLGVV